MKQKRSRREKSQDERVSDDEENAELDRLLEDELQQLAEDPSLLGDLKRLTRETRNVGTDVQDDLNNEESAYSGEERDVQSSLSEKVEDIIEQNTKSIVGVITNSQLQDYYKAFTQ